MKIHILPFILKSLLFLLFVGLQACVHDYTPSDDFLEQGRQNQLVVNSYLSPDKIITIDFYQSRSNVSTQAHVLVNDIQVQIWEDNQLLCDTLCTNGKFFLPHYPVEGKTYRLVAQKEETLLSASTSIPKSIDLTAVYHDFDYNDGYMTMGYWNFDVTLKQKETQTPIWLVVLAKWKDEDFIQLPYMVYCSSNVLLDDVNREISNNMPTSVTYPQFMRIAERASPSEINLSFSTRARKKVNLDKDNNYSFDISPDSLRLSAIVGSKEYDRYCRSVYKQTAFEITPDMALVYEPVNIYSNITNGLGIFAGYNTTHQDIRLNNIMTDTTERNTTAFKESNNYEK